MEKEGMKEGREGGKGEGRKTVLLEFDADRPCYWLLRNESLLLLNHFLIGLPISTIMYMHARTHAHTHTHTHTHTQHTCRQKSSMKRRVRRQRTPSMLWKRQTMIQTPQKPRWIRYTV